jgi:hypothetical protein
MQLSDDFPMMLEREAGMPDNCPQVAVAFGLYPMLDRKKTETEGREVYKDVEFVKIAVPGDRNSLFFQPAEGTHRKRFPRAYDAYKQREVVPVNGTPIENWPPVSRSVAMNLRTAHIHTVEDLAQVHDGNVDKICSNGRELREKAKAWLDNAKNGAAAIQLAADKKALQDQLAAMQAQIVALSGARGGDDTDDAAAAARKPRKAS